MEIVDINKMKVLYDDKLVYHNFEHAKKVLDKSIEIANRCIEEGIEVDKDVLYIAAIFHDADYIENYKAKGFDSREELSANIAEEFLAKLQMKMDFIQNVKKTIMGTHKDSDFNSIEAKILRAADLSGLAGEYGEFEKNDKLLKQEFEYLNKVEISKEEWKQKTKELIEFYLSQDINLTSKYYDSEGESIFHKKAKENLTRYIDS